MSDQSSAEVRMASAGEDTAVRRTFDVLELREHILSYLPSRDIVRARQVDRSTCALVMSSPKLHRSIFTNTTGLLVGPGLYYWSFYHCFWAKTFRANLNAINPTPPTLQNLIDDYNYGARLPLVAPMRRTHRICTVHKIFSRSQVSMSVDDCVRITFEGRKFLELMEARGSGMSDHVFDGASGVCFLDFSTKVCRIKIEELTLGRLCREVRAQLKKAKGNAKLPTKLVLNDHLLDDRKVVAEAKRMLEMPGAETEEGKKLMKAVEEAGKAMFAELRDGQADDEELDDEELENS